MKIKNSICALSISTLAPLPVSGVTLAYSISGTLETAGPADYAGATFLISGTVDTEATFNEFLGSSFGLSTYVYDLVDSQLTLSGTPANDGTYSLSLLSGSALLVSDWGGEIVPPFTTLQPDGLRYLLEFDGPSGINRFTLDLEFPNNFLNGGGVGAPVGPFSYPEQMLSAGTLSADNGATYSINSGLSSSRAIPEPSVSLLALVAGTGLGLGSRRRR